MGFFFSLHNWENLHWDEPMKRKDKTYLGKMTLNIRQAVLWCSQKVSQFIGIAARIIHDKTS